MATEVSDNRYGGTALALQVGLSFALTVISIRLVPWIVDQIGWQWVAMILFRGILIAQGRR